jgi:hypothetical protein
MIPQRISWIIILKLDGVAETKITEDYLLKNRAKLKTVIPSDSSNLKPCRLHGLQGDQQRIKPRVEK